MLSSSCFPTIAAEHGSYSFPQFPLKLGHRYVTHSSRLSIGDWCLKAVRSAGILSGDGHWLLYDGILMVAMAGVGVSWVST